MRNLKRLRGWIAFVAAACRSYLQQLAKAKVAEDRPETPDACSSTVVSSQQTSLATPSCKTVDVIKAPVVQVTTDITSANGKAHQSAQRLARVLISEIKLYYLNKME